MLGAAATFCMGCAAAGQPDPGLDFCIQPSPACNTTATAASHACIHPVILRSVGALICTVVILRVTRIVLDTGSCKDLKMMRSTLGSYLRGTGRRRGSGSFPRAPLLGLFLLALFALRNTDVISTAPGPSWFFVLPWFDRWYTSCVSLWMLLLDIISSCPLCCPGTVRCLSCPRSTGNVVLFGDDFVCFRIRRNAWSDSGYTFCSAQCSVPQWIHFRLDSCSASVPKYFWTFFYVKE